LNDPDAWLWVSIYLIGAFCCLAIIFGLYLPVFYLIIIALYLIYALKLFISPNGVWEWATQHRMQNIAASMQATKPWIEITREFFGLLIVCAVLLINYLAY
jgi:H+/Cl- antiporter ClcA